MNFYKILTIVAGAFYIWRHKP